MVIDTPIVEYSALSRSSSGNIDVMSPPTHLRFRWNRIFKRFYHDENNREQTIMMNVDERVNQTERKMTSLHNRKTQLQAKQQEMKSSSSFESLPFTDPYFSNEKFIEQGKPSSSSVTSFAMTKPIDDEAEKFWSTISPSDCRRLAPLPQSTRLRRLQSKSKIRSIVNANRFNKCYTSSVISPRRSSISSSIARRIELLKDAVERHQHDTLKSSRENVDHSRFIYKIVHQSTQTNEQLFDSTVFHSIHHHYLHYLPCLSIEWRSIISIVGMIGLIIMFFIDIFGVFL